MNLQYGLYPYQAGVIPAGFCNAPSPFTAELNGDIVTLAWVPAHEVLYYILTIKDSGGATVFTTNLNASRYITQLNPNSSFTAEITAVCSDDPVRKSETLTVAFNTGNHVVVCMPVNTGSVAFTLLTKSVLMTWPAVTDALAYTVYYKVKNTLMAYDKAVTQTNQIEIPMLIPNTVYEYYIVTNCKDGKSATSDTGSFQTPIDADLCPPPDISVIVNGSTAIVAWKYTGLHDSFDIYLNGLLYLANYSSNLVNLSNLAALTEYTIAVVGKCGSGNSIAGTKSFTTEGTPCAKPGTLTAVVGLTSTTVSWDAIAGATAYDVVVNGTKSTIADPQIVIPTQPNTSYTVSVSTVCATGTSIPETTTFNSPDGCYGIPENSIVATVTPTEITLDWKDLPAIDHYEVRYKLYPAGEWNPWIKTNNSQYTFSQLTPSTDYQFQVKNFCLNGNTAFTDKQVATAGPIVGGKPLITLIDNITSSSMTVHFTVPDGSVKGNFVVKVRNTTTNTTTEVTTSVLFADIPGLDPHTTYEFIVEDRKPGYTIVPSDPVSEITCYVCAAVSNLQAVFTEIGDINVSWNAALGADHYKIYTYELEDWQYKGQVDTLAYVVTGNAFKYVPVKVVSVYDDCNSNCAAEGNIVCPQVTGLTHELMGTTAVLQWDALDGVLGYQVIIRSLTSVDEKWTDKPWASFENLEPDTTYSYTVQAFCTLTDKGLESEPDLFTTEAPAPVDTGCDEADFTAVSQASTLADPAAEPVCTVDNTDPAIVHFKTEIGSGFDRSMTFKLADGTPRDITGYLFEMNVFRPDANTVTLLTFTNANGGVLNGGATGKITLLKTDVEMAVLSVEKYAYILKWKPVGGVWKDILTGDFIVNDADPTTPSL